MSKQTTFAAWLTMMQFTNAEAAAALGLSLRWVKCLKAGREGDKPARPDKRTRLAMAALYHRLDPWGQ